MNRLPLLVAALVALNLVLVGVVVYVLSGRSEPSAAVSEEQGPGEVGASPRPSVARPAGPRGAGRDPSAPASAGSPVAPSPAAVADQIRDYRERVKPKPKPTIAAQAMRPAEDGKFDLVEVGVIDEAPHHVDLMMDAVRATPDQRRQVKELWEEMLRRRLEAHKEAEKRKSDRVDEEAWRVYERDWNDRLRAVMTPQQLLLLKQIEEDAGLVSGDREIEP